MTIAVDWDVKHQTKQKKQGNTQSLFVKYCKALVFGEYFLFGAIGVKNINHQNMRPKITVFISFQ